MPSFNFPQYQESLLSKGICYSQSVLDFKQVYYVEKIGMLDGAAAEFVHSAKQIVGKQRKEKEHVRKKRKLANKENQPICVETPKL